MSRRFFNLLQQIKNHCSTAEQTIRTELELTEAEFSALQMFKSGETLQNREFSQMMNLSVSRGSRLVYQLQSKGYLLIEPVPENRRSLAISLTRRGIAVQAEIVNKIKQHEETCLQHLSEDEVHTLSENLESVIRLLKSHISETV